MIDEIRKKEGKVSLAEKERLREEKKAKKEEEKRLKEEAEMEKKREEEEKKIENAPEATLDDLLICFGVSGIFKTEFIILLRPFLTKESYSLMNQMLSEYSNLNEKDYIRTSVAYIIIEERFSVYKGEFEMIRHKSMKTLKELRKNINPEILERLEQITLKEKV